MTTLSNLAAAAALAAAAPTPVPLNAEITALDARVFDAYNRCDLATFERYFDPHVAFFHDTGGATFDRATVIANTRRYICGKVRRELLPATLRIYPIKDFGAIEEGEHRFCELASGRCEGVARFVIVWARRGPSWRITNVLSYGHRALTQAEREDPPTGR